MAFRFNPLRLPRRMAWRLLLGFGLVVGLMLLTLSLARHQMAQMSQTAQQVAAHDIPRLLRIQLLALHSESASTGLLQILNLPRMRREPVYATIDEGNRLMKGVIDSLRADEALPETLHSTLVQLTDSRDQYLAAYSDMVDEIEGEDRIRAQAIFSDRVQPALLRMQTLAAEIQTTERGALEERLNATWIGFERSTWLTFVLFGVALLVAVLLAWLTSRSVVRPLALVAAGARRIADGDYQTPIPSTRTIEVDAVVNAMNHMASAVAEREAAVKRMAFTDPLTHLPNRTALLDTPPTDLALSSGGVLCVLDIARLRAINETLGFATGDELIALTAQRLEDLSPASSLLAYVAGGRFGLWLPGMTPDLMEPWIQEVSALHTQTVAHGMHKVDVQLVLGLAHAPSVNDANGIALLLRNAEMAQLNAKRRTHGWAWYEPSQEATRLDQLGLLSDLRTAADTDQLQMWLQPKVALNDGTLLGCEALVRWAHPTRGFISPADFVPFAERTGAVTVLTDWMLERAMSCLSRWQDQGISTGISVNLSTRDLQKPNLVESLAQRLSFHGIAPQGLTLEVTESGLMDDPQGAVQTLHALRELGFKLSIDDFGTGYSSLAYLQTLPVHELKIDRSFVRHLDRDANNRLLVSAMVTMAHGLSLSVTAEGVETTTEAQCLHQLKVNVLQGYLCGKPMPEYQFEHWQAKYQPTPPHQLPPILSTSRSHADAPVAAARS